ncbi:MAG: hypothetical protein SGPRY_004217, partial [Prymnesium sp.]
PAFQYAKAVGDEEKVSSEEHWWSLAGLVATFSGFVFYLFMMVKQSGSELNEQKTDLTIAKYLTHGSDITLTDDNNGDGKLSASELAKLLAELGEHVPEELEEKWMAQLDPDKSGMILPTDCHFSARERPCFSARERYIENVDELVQVLLAYITEKMSAVPEVSEEGIVEVEEEEQEDDDEVEMPEDLQQLSYEQQQTMIKKRAFTMMGLGTVLIIIFSDPMVDVMSNVGERLTIPPFYIAFVLAPIASNASELLASYAYAGKKTKKTITVSLAALEGAACMNNTFCLSIFMGLIYFKKLAWKFSAETVTILLVEVIVALVAMQKTQRLLHGVMVALIFPASIALVAAIEAMGFD